VCCCAQPKVRLPSPPSTSAQIRCRRPAHQIAYISAALIRRKQRVAMMCTVRLISRMLIWFVDCSFKMLYFQPLSSCQPLSMCYDIILFALLVGALLFRTQLVRCFSLPNVFWQMSFEKPYNKHNHQRSGYQRHSSNVSIRSFSIISEVETQMFFSVPFVQHSIVYVFSLKTDTTTANRQPTISTSPPHLCLMASFPTK